MEKTDDNKDGQKGNVAVVVSVVVLAIIFLAAFLFHEKDLMQNEVLKDNNKEISQEKRTAVMKLDEEGDFYGVLFESGIFGAVDAIDKNGSVLILASLSGLPELEDGYFYEAWVSKKDSDDLMSAGRLQNVLGAYIVTYEFHGDLFELDSFILTLETEDGEDRSKKKIIKGIFE